MFCIDKCKSLFKKAMVALFYGSDKTLHRERTEFFKLMRMIIAVTRVDVNITHYFHVKLQKWQNGKK